MIEHSEIVSSLTPLNGVFFSISNLDQYASKITTFGKSIEYRDTSNGEIISYILYYDNEPEIFISMVWTCPEHQKKGYAKKLLKQLIKASHKNIRLEVHRENFAIHLYEQLGFEITDRRGDTYLMYLKKSIAVMQPYLFPYLGYFHLIDASHLFVFYDDVNYIIRGWINRNYILLNGQSSLFTVPISKASQNKLINETALAINAYWRDKFQRTLQQAYSKAPYFSQVESLIAHTFSANVNTISELAIHSIINVCQYLDMPFNYARSSICSPETKGIGKAERLIAIAKQQGYSRYVNAAGGKNLYEKDFFKNYGIELGFIESDIVQYKQFSNPFAPSLSIIDVLMFNDPKSIQNLLKRYTIV